MTAMRDSVHNTATETKATEWNSEINTVVVYDDFQMDSCEKRTIDFSFLEVCDVYVECIAIIFYVCTLGATVQLIHPQCITNVAHYCKPTSVNTV